MAQIPAHSGSREMVQRRLFLSKLCLILALSMPLNGPLTSVRYPNLMCFILGLTLLNLADVRRAPGQTRHTFRPANTRL